MEGIIRYLNREIGYGKIELRDNSIRILNIYFGGYIPKEVSVGTSVYFDLTTSKTNNTYARFKGVVRRNTVLFNTEDRDKWYEYGEVSEKNFINKVAPTLKIDIRENPEKKCNKWAIDLYDYTNNRYADLKEQDTPFFTASRYYYNGIPYDPSFTVTFNKKDYEYYSTEYKDCDIYFWVNWKQLSYEYNGNTIKVLPIKGVWVARFEKMASMIESGRVVLHKYIHRKNDSHNARDSYLFSLSDTNIFKKLL